MVRMLTTSVAFTALVLPAALLAAGGRQTGPDAVDTALVAACVQSQQQVMAAADAANRRMEIARQTNQPAAMRAAMDDLQGVLSTMRAQLAPCAQLQTVAAPPADASVGHVMPAPAASAPAATAPPSAPRAPAAARAGGPAQSPPAAAPAGSAAHVMVQAALDAAKLSCSPKIDPKSAAKTTYQGKTYYFCSTKDRDEFLKNPATSLAMMPPKQ